MSPVRHARDCTVAFAPLRVAHVIHALAPESGGPSVSVPALCEALGRLGLDVKAHATDHGRPPTLVPQHFSLRTHRSVPLGGKLGISPAMHRALVRDACRGSLVHSHGLWLWTNLDAHLTAARMNVPHIVSPRGMLEPYSLRRSRTLKSLVWTLLQGRALREARCIHVTSLAELAAARAVGLVNPIAVIPNGVSMPKERPRPVGEARRLLFLGRVDHKKGVDTLLRAWSRLAPAFPDWAVDIVGPSHGRYAQEMQSLVRELGIPRVRFLGPAFGEARDLAYAEADLFVLPTRSENFGMAVAEALAAGLPVVCTKAAPWRELEERRCGFWINEGVEPLIACLEEALRRDRGALQEMGDQGREWMRSEFSWDAQACKMASVYAWLVGRQTRPAHVHLA